MDLRALRAFVEVVRQGGFTRAARTVFITQSAVSKAVRQIEDEIGAALLDRAVPGIRLTAAGEVVLRRAQAMLAERDDLLAELAELRGLQRGVLRLGLPAIGSSLLFAPVFADYRRRHPGIDIRLVEQGSKRLEELVLAGDIELAASLLPVPDVFDWQVVQRERVELLVAAEHPLARRAQVALAELAGQPLILFGEGFALNPLVVDACRRAGFEPTVATRSSQVDFVVELVASGLGLGFLPASIAHQRAHPGVRALPLDDAHLRWDLALVWRRGGHLSAAARAWLERVRAHHRPEEEAG